MISPPPVHRRNPLPGLTLWTGGRSVAAEILLRNPVDVNLERRALSDGILLQLSAANSYRRDNLVHTGTDT